LVMLIVLWLSTVAKHCCFLAAVLGVVAYMWSSNTLNNKPTRYKANHFTLQG